MIIVSYIFLNRSYNFIVDPLSVVLNSMAIIIHFKLYFFLQLFWRRLLENLKLQVKL